MMIRRLYHYCYSYCLLLILFLAAHRPYSQAFAPPQRGAIHHPRSSRWTRVAASTTSSPPSPPPPPSSKKRTRNAYYLYKDYAKRLWHETNPEARHKIASERSILLMKQLVLQLLVENQEEEPEETTAHKQQVVTACQAYLAALPNKQQQEALQLDALLGAAVEQELQQSSIEPKQHLHPTAPLAKKKRRSIGFGAAMGLAVAGWVFSGNYIFTTLFTLMTILGQLEYYRMVINTGVYPARRISVVGACSMFLTALLSPNLHQICLPLFGLYAMVWFLTMKRSVTTIPEIATTFTGMFYLGYVPSFWVRIRLMDETTRPLTRLAPLAAPLLRYLRHHVQLPTPLASTIHLPITSGAIFIFWTWLSLAFSDVGAYFVGKSLGHTKLGVIAPAAGATSPNKTVEGVLGGCAVSAGLGMLGAWVQKWPFWMWTGALHGCLLGLIGLIGDLTASMLKRDAGLKDFGDFIPEHGGILDRVDSFVWAAPYSWLVCVYAIPALRAMAAR